jgi:hypothetical protein
VVGYSTVLDISTHFVSLGDGCSSVIDALSSSCQQRLKVLELAGKAYTQHHSVLWPVAAVACSPYTAMY